MTEFQIYRDKKNEWRWRAWRKGRIVAESGEGYKRRGGAERTLGRIIASIRCGKYFIAVGLSPKDTAKRKTGS